MTYPLYQVRSFEYNSISCLHHVDMSLIWHPTQTLPPLLSSEHSPHHHEQDTNLPKPPFVVPPNPSQEQEQLEQNTQIPAQPPDPEHDDQQTQEEHKTEKQDDRKKHTKDTNTKNGNTDKNGGLEQVDR